MTRAEDDDFVPATIDIGDGSMLIRPEYGAFGPDVTALPARHR
jgi:hypothetical protein